MKNCIDCGIDHQIPASGNLFIQHNQEWDAYFYENDEMLLKTLFNLNDHVYSYKVGVSTSEQPPLFTMDLDRLIAKIENRDIVDVINHGELTGHIQPIYDLRTNQLYAYESLLRTVKAIPPAKLFQVAEQTGMISKLDKRAREIAIQLRAQAISPGIKSFINFLPSTIYNPEYCLQHTFQLVKRYKIDPNDLVFEVVETEKIQDVEHLQRVFETYKKQGIKVALDDLGAGFSTLEMLEMLRPDYVKIDRHYIDHCDQVLEKQKFLENVLQLSKELDIRVLAEGIERVEELEHCRSIGVDFAQGYYLGRPKPPLEYAVN